MALSCLSWAEDKTEVTVSCPGYQTAFKSSCYEFVDLEHSFFSAQAWCEQKGGHLAFIPDEDTQYFFQRHLDPEKDIWLGVAPSASPKLPFSPTDKGPLSWLDGSHIIYSNWISSPQPGAACGHILKNSGLRWKATRNCNQNLHFICQFESGRSIVCEGRNTTLQCGSGQVLMIDGGFYGRKNIYYCQSKPSAITTSTHQCGWVDVADSLKAHCHSRQVCHIEKFVDSFGEPCPQLGSYLSVDYHCRDGLTLSVSTVAAVFSDVTIGVKWLLHLPRGNISCTLSAGDSHVIYLQGSDGLESSVVHKYTHPSAFVVAAECTSNDLHITAQKKITIQEPITEFGVIRCNAGDMSFMETDCKALYGEPLKIQIEVKAGTNVTYRIQRDDVLLSSVSVAKGISPRNITVTQGIVKQLGTGCHQLILYASNMVTYPEVSTELQVCVLEDVAGLQASLLADRGDCLDSSDITVGVSLERGAPVLLFFLLTSDSSSFSETREMNTRNDMFHIERPIQEDDVPIYATFTIETSSPSDPVTQKTVTTVTTAKPEDSHEKTDATVEPANTPPGTTSATTVTEGSHEKTDATVEPANTPPGTTSATTVTEGSHEKTDATVEPANTPPGTTSATTVTEGSHEKTDATVEPANTPPRTTSATTVTEGSHEKTDATVEPANTPPGTTSATTVTADPGGTTSQAINNNSDELSCSISPKSGKLVRCSRNNEAKSVFLPLGDSSSNFNLGITATAKHKSFVARTTITTQVLNSAATSNTVDHLQASVTNAVAQLKKQGLLSGVTLGQLFSSVSNKLNGQTDVSQKDDRQKLREQMLDVMVGAVKEVPSETPGEVLVTARGLASVIQKGAELSVSAQEEASLLIENLSSSLLHMGLEESEENKKEMYNAGSTVVEGVSNILDYSSNKKISDALLVALKNMMSSDKNPFSWNERGNISGLVGHLSLTTKDGSNIPVENLKNDIEILLPRPVGEQVNTSVMDLRNYSTTNIDIPSADTTLVLKMVPSEDPLPFKLFLGHINYPTETNYVAMTEMPHRGTTQEERYTWLLDPKKLKGNIGVHYLVVRPIVGPGVKFINANLSITSIVTACKFWNESLLDWSDNGCRVSRSNSVFMEVLLFSKVGVGTTHLVTQCLCNHLTFFGSSFFVTPNLVDPSRTVELFGTFTENPVVVCFMGAIFVAYLLVVVWARRKDIQDVAKVKVSVLEDNNPMDEYRYLLSVSTGHRRGASTSSQVTITLFGAEGNSEPHHLTDPKKCVFERGAVDIFLLTTPFSLGDLQGIRLWHNNSGRHPAWYVGNVMVQDLQSEQKWHFLCNSWLAIDIGDCSLDKVFPVSTEMDLKRFSNLFFLKTTKDFSDGHLWYSVINRPASSSFTRVQRVSCCFSLLLCTMLTSIMFYGIPTDPSEQTMDLGHFEFTWQQFMIGVQSSLMMFPVNILIVSIFRYTRPRETSCCKRKREEPDAPEQENTSQSHPSQTATSNMNTSVTLDSVIKDITGIANSLSKTVKSNIPCTDSEFGPGQQADINAVLSVVEDFIRQNKISENTHSKTQNLHSFVQPQLPENSDTEHPKTTVDGIQKMSNKTQYLYQQLCHIDKELSLLGPSRFPTSHSYNQALHQVQGMKSILEDQQPTQKHDGDGNQKKKICCHGGLPWWFIFVGWLLVIATSFVAGYFTMLYGLKFGKQRSISWLISMIISFFQSILVIQPLKVVCLAVFFALVIKKVEEDDLENVPIKGNDRNPDDCKGTQTVRRDSSLYEPPPPADIEKMRMNKIKEQKAFALLREILTYMGFLWMLLLVAYGQRDPNAFFLNKHIRKSFSEDITDSMSLGDVFTWANTSLLNNLFGVYPGFITDGNSKLVGNARLRQVRVRKNSCETAGSMLQFVPDCFASYSWEVEDTGSYDPGWNHSLRDNISMSTFGPWEYQTEAHLRAYPVWGHTVLYRGGGFVAELGPNSQNASSTLEHLFTNKWLDTHTRAIFVEFTVYNANVNLFCIVTLLFETTEGAFQFHSELHTVRLYQSTGGLHIFVMAAEIIYLLFILYYMFLQGKLMKQQRCAYFKSKWNLLELTIILLSWSAVAIFIKRTVLSNRDMDYYHNNKDQFASFYETATTDSLLQHLIAFLVLLATIKLWHLLRLNPKMNMITAALQRAWSDISGFVVIIVIMLIAYAIVCNVLYGWKMSSYRTLLDALLRIISLQIGIFNYDEVLVYNTLLGALLIGSCIVFMSFVVLNFFISGILEAFSQEQIHHKPSEEEEIVDLMLKKICSLFGIRYQVTKDTLGPDMNSSSGLTFNNSRNVPRST
ncbi:polycystin-1-like protein 2 [Scomber scombrus]|uniref:polycystin-1-like protein 2 n=1 Tax=Scomber scombrus TaxID=13677 RepID=UPI002DDA071D|nr:polycystin-1-like protein 2 [Scomber scombrus]